MEEKEYIPDGDMCRGCNHEKEVWETCNTIHYECDKYTKTLMCWTFCNMALCGFKCEECKNS